MGVAVSSVGLAGSWKAAPGGQPCPLTPSTVREGGRGRGASCLLCVGLRACASTSREAADLAQTNLIIELTRQATGYRRQEKSTLRGLAKIIRAKPLLIAGAGTSLALRIWE